MEFGLDQLLVRSWSNCIHPSGHVEAVAAWDHYTEQRGGCSIHDRGDWYGEKGHLVQSLYTATHPPSADLQCTQCRVITFRVSRRPREMYCGHARLCVCVSVLGRMPTLLHRPGCNLGEW